MLKISFFGHLNCNFAKLMSKNHATSQKIGFFSTTFISMGHDINNAQ